MRHGFHTATQASALLDLGNRHRIRACQLGLGANRQCHRPLLFAFLAAAEL